jgi:hypothetical protein
MRGDHKDEAARVRALVKARVDEMCQKKGVNYASISRRCGKGPQYLSEYFKRGRPAFFPEVFRRKFAQITGLDEETLKSPEIRDPTRRPKQGPQSTADHSLRDAATAFKVAAAHFIDELLDVLDRK